MLFICLVPESDMMDSVNGILMMQDLQLGTLVALLPFFGGGDLSPDHTQKLGTVVSALQLVQVLFGFPLLVFIFRFLAAKIVDRFHRFDNPLP